MLTDAELDACAALMHEVAVRAMERIVTERPRADQVATKSWAADWVTETDLAVERLVREAIAERFPDHRIEGEEFGVTGAADAPASWLIDPVDGTTNYVHGLPMSTFSLCVSDEAGAAAALVADPTATRCFPRSAGVVHFATASRPACPDARTLMGGIVLTEYQAQSIWRGMAGVDAGARRGRLRDEDHGLERVLDLRGRSGPLRCDRDRRLQPGGLPRRGV